MIAVLTDPVVGGTFLNWTIHYLAGHENYFRSSSNRFVTLNSDPVTDVNAHRFLANHPVSLSEFIKDFKKISSTPTDTFHTIYFHNFNPLDEFKQAVDTVQSVADKLVVLTLNSSNILYSTKFVKRTGQYSYATARRYLTNSQEIYEDFIDHFFDTSKKQFDLDKNNTVWNQREFIALTINHKTYPCVVDYVDKSKIHYLLESTELFNRFEFTVKQLFDFLDVKIDQSRWDNWYMVYQKWRQIHINSLQFSLYFDTIVDAIVKNYYIDLLRFNLDIMQEAAIQRELLIKHNLALKSFQITKFTDTQQLHKLLEENIYHKL